MITNLINQLGQRSSATVETSRTNTGSLVTRTKCKCDSLAIYSEFKSRDTLSVRVITQEVAVEVPAKLTWWESTKVKQSDLQFDQLIQEFDRWVHVSYTAVGINRRQCLRAIKVDGVTKYIPD